MINIHNAENWLGIDSDSDISLFKSIKIDCDAETLSLGSGPKGERILFYFFFIFTLFSIFSTGNIHSDDDSETVSREASPCAESPQTAVPAPFVGNESPNESTNSSVTQADHATSTNDLNLAVTAMTSTMTTTLTNGSGFPTALISRVNPFVKVKKKF